jgi:hypothetical protein
MRDCAVRECLGAVFCYRTVAYQYESVSCIFHSTNSYLLTVRCIVIESSAVTLNSSQFDALLHGAVQRLLETVLYWKLRERRTVNTCYTDCIIRNADCPLPLSTRTLRLSTLCSSRCSSNPARILVHTMRLFLCDGHVAMDPARSNCLCRALILSGLNISR